MISARLRQRAIDALLDHVAWLEGKPERAIWHAGRETRDVARRAYSVANPDVWHLPRGGLNHSSLVCAMFIERYAAAASLLAAGWYPGWEDGP